MSMILSGYRVMGRGIWCVSWNMQVCTGMHSHVSVGMQCSVWIIIFLVTGLAAGVCRGGHCSHRPSTSLASMCGNIWKILFMNARWAHLRTYLLHCWCSHTHQWLKHSSSCYLFSCEMSKNAYQSWRWTFWRFIIAAKMRVMENHVQPLSVISCYSKHVCHVQILTFPAHSCVMIENHTDCDKAFFTQNDLRNKLLKLRYKVMKHTVYWLVINCVKGLFVCVCVRTRTHTHTQSSFFH
jgi:hypothetical protein